MKKLDSETRKRLKGLSMVCTSLKETLDELSVNTGQSPHLEHTQLDSCEYLAKMLQENLSELMKK